MGLHDEKARQCSQVGSMRFRTNQMIDRKLPHPRTALRMGVFRLDPEIPQADPRILASKNGPSRRALACRSRV